MVRAPERCLFLCVWKPFIFCFCVEAVSRWPTVGRVSLFLSDCSDDEVPITRYAGSSNRNAAYVCVCVCMCVCMYDQLVSE